MPQVEHAVHQKVTVPFAYPVWFTRALFAPENPTLCAALQQDPQSQPHRALAVVDAGLVAACPALPSQIMAYGQAHADIVNWVAPPQMWPGGEAAKNEPDRIWQLVNLILEKRLCRHSFVVIVGGGAVLDAVGFAAALVHRGVRVIRVPSTTLAQNDAGVGVKNGINGPNGKNAVGTFQPPFAVLNDFDLLHYLPPIQWVGGIAEAFKVALIKSVPFFHACCANAARYRDRDAAALEECIIQCADFHLAHIRSHGDPFEMGRARPLDFGHWSAHKLEAMSGYRITHGEAVATGLLLDAIYASRQGWLAARHVTALRQALQTIGFPLVYPELQQRAPDGGLAILGGLDDFQEHLGGELCVTFPRGLGRKQEIHHIDRGLMQQAVDALVDSIE